MPTLSVIVPSTAAPPAAACVAAIEEQLGAADELIVQRSPEGAGPALARNIGAGRARGEVLVFVDADVVLGDGALERIRSHMAGPDAPQAVFGAYDDNPADPGIVSRYRNLLHRHVHLESAGEAGSFWAGLGAVDAVAFAAAGGFDAQRFRAPSVEDIELGMRLRDAGARIVLDPAIEGKHLKRWTLRSMVLTDHTRRGRPWVRLLAERGGPPPATLNLSARRRASALASAAVLAALAARRPAIAAGAIATVAALNADLLSLMASRGGPRLAVAAVPLQVAHELAGSSAVPVGVAQHALAGGRGALS